jgi:hypothetical protein
MDAPPSPVTTNNVPPLTLLAVPVLLSFSYKFHLGGENFKKIPRSALVPYPFSGIAVCRKNECCVSVRILLRDFFEYSHGWSLTFWKINPFLSTEYDFLHEEHLIP